MSNTKLDEEELLEGLRRTPTQQHLDNIFEELRVRLLDAVGPDGTAIAISINDLIYANLVLREENKQ